MNRPNILSYLDYREFLNSYIEYLRERGDFSNRDFAKKIGIKGHSFIKSVIDRKKDLSLDLARRVVEALALSAEERDFFLLLLEFDQAKDSLSKEEAYEKILKHFNSQKIRQTIQAEYQVGSSCVANLIFEAIETKWGQKSIKEMASDLQTTEEEVNTAIQALEGVGWIKKEGAFWKKQEAALESPLETQSLALRKLYREILERSKRALDELEPGDRRFGSLTLALDKDSAELAYSKLMETLKEIHSLHLSSKKSESVYQIGIQVFPMLRLSEVQDQNDAQ